MTLKFSSTKSSYPKNIHFSENPKNIEIQSFEPPKMARAYACMEISEYSPLPLLGLVVLLEERAV